MIALFSVLTFFLSFFSCLLPINHNRTWLLWFQSMVAVSVLPINSCLVKHCASEAPTADIFYHLKYRMMEQKTFLCFVLWLWWASGTQKWDLKLSKADCRHAREIEESALERKKTPPAKKKKVLKPSDLLYVVWTQLHEHCHHDSCSWQSHFYSWYSLPSWRDTFAEGHKKALSHMTKSLPLLYVSPGSIHRS